MTNSVRLDGFLHSSAAQWMNDRVSLPYTVVEVILVPFLRGRASLAGEFCKFDKRNRHMLNTRFNSQSTLSTHARYERLSQFFYTPWSLRSPRD